MCLGYCLKKTDFSFHENVVQTQIISDAGLCQFDFMSAMLLINQTRLVVDETDFSLSS